MALILFRYFAREVYATLVATTCILLIVLISNQILRYLQDAAAGEITAFSLIKLLVVQAPLLIGFLLPLGFFISVLLVLGRWSVDRELTVCFASGLSRGQLLQYITGFGIGVLAVVTVLMFWVEPYMNWYRKNVIAYAEASSPIKRMLPGHFQQFFGGWVFYTQSISEDQTTLNHVFAAKLPDDNARSDRYTVVAARSARKVMRDKLPYLEFQKGHRYEGQPGSGDFQIAQYDRYGVKLQAAPPKVGDDPEFMSMRELWHSMDQKPKAAAEFQWRLTMPLSVLLLGWVAIALSSVKPARSRFSLLLPGLLLYIGYADLLFISRAWLKEGAISRYAGLWWVHGLMALVTLVLLLRYFDCFQRWRRPRKVPHS